MDNKIKQNLVYLADNLRNLDRIILQLIQSGIISPNESEEIRNGNTSLKIRNFKLLGVLLRKNFPINAFVNILRSTENGHCAEKIEKTTTANTDNTVDVQFDGYERTINKNIEIAMELIRGSQGNVAYDILLICGYIQPDSIPKEFFKAVLNIHEEEFNSAMELLTQYSLIGQETKTIKEEKQELFNIHRLLQQVIRQKGRKTEKETLRKIFSSKGFMEYKLLPFTKYANEELRKEFPKIKAELVDQRQLLRLLREMRFEESLELAKLIHKEIETNTSKFNYAICLGKNGQLEDERNVLEDLYRQDVEEEMDYDDDDVEIGLMNLEAYLSKSLIGGHLLISLWKMNNQERMQGILQQRNSFQMIPSQEMRTTLMKILNSNLISSNYSLACEGWSMIKLVMGGDTKKIDFKYFSADLSLSLPHNLQELVFFKMHFKDGNGKDANVADICQWLHSLPKKLNRLEMSWDNTNIILPLELISSIENIYLSDCSLSLNSANQISPRVLKLQKVIFVENGQELVSNVKVNEFIDFHKMKRLELVCPFKKNLSIDLSEESANLEFLRLDGVNVLSLKSANGRVNIKEAEIWHCSLDLSILPSSLEKLYLFSTEVFVSGEIDLPNLKYLKLEEISNLSHFRSLELTYLYLKEVEEVNVDFLPPTAKIIRIDRSDWGTRFLGGVIHLDKLILEDFPLNQLETVLPHFQIKQLVLSKYNPQYTPVDLTKLLEKQIPTIAIGPIDWEKEDFEISVLSKQVDRQSELYLFQGGTGKAVEEKHFNELYLLEDIF